MDKQKQIEEMAKDRVAELRLFYNFCKYNGCEEKTAEDCENCYFRKVYNRLAELEGEIRNGTLKEIPDSIAGVPVSDLLFIAKIVGDNPCLIEQIKDGYSFGHAVGYNAGFALFEKNMHEAILRMSSEPIRLERGDDFNFTKVKFEMPPYKLQNMEADNARLYGVKITDAPKEIMVAIKTEKTEEAKE